MSSLQNNKDSIIDHEYEKNKLLKFYPFKLKESGDCYAQIKETKDQF